MNPQDEEFPEPRKQCANWPFCQDSDYCPHIRMDLTVCVSPWYTCLSKVNTRGGRAWGSVTEDLPSICVLGHIPGTAKQTQKNPQAKPVCLGLVLINVSQTMNSKWVTMNPKPCWELIAIKHLQWNKCKGFLWVTPFHSKGAKRSCEYATLESLGNIT
jgi:hypothetical protein